VATRGGPFPDVSAAVLRRRAGKMLAHLGLEDVELSVALVNDAAIRELNREYRHKDKPTDVLAFPMSDAPMSDFPAKGAKAAKGAKGAKSAKSANGTKSAGQPRSGMLGDVILSIETARRQAQANDRALLAELTMLLAHGLLHLLGHDHQTDREERAMTARTKELEEVAGSARANEKGSSGKQGKMK
jgi:probable rRNA maturation factor